ncbi:MAG: hypothetical protein EA352_04540 [Gemmatimonadales bacterium]|nr:MAG: hypothetical protein EA352_04540 [Gemmatimonadales bacterium]
MSQSFPACNSCTPRGRAGGLWALVVAAVLVALVGSVWGRDSDVRAEAVRPPSTDVVVMEVHPHLDHLHAGSVTNITDRDGYDNQPSFMDEDRLLFSSVRGGEASNIMVHSWSRGTAEVLADTPESEYSPRLMPSGDAVSVVRVEMDGVSQHLVRIALDGGEARRLLPELDDIGYYAWIDEARVAVWRLGGMLDLANVETGEVERVAEGVSPGVQAVPRDPMASFVRVEDGEATVYLLDGRSGEVEAVATTPGGTVEHAWLSSATLLTIHDGVVHRWMGGGEEPWAPVLEDLREVHGNFTRMATSPSGTRWAVVVERDGPGS